MILRFLGLISLFVAVSAAQAHPGHVHELGVALESGISHPWTGIDHLFAMVLVGLIAMQLDFRSRWWPPVLFCCAMTVASVAGHAIGSGPQLEIAIALTLVALGVCLVRRPANCVALVIVLICGGLHGFAHGTGLSSGDVSVRYLAGMILGTALLHLVGIGLGITLNQSRFRSTWFRVSGTVACAVGIAVLVGMV